MLQATPGPAQGPSPTASVVSLYAGDGHSAGAGEPWAAGKAPRRDAPCGLCPPRLLCRCASAHGATDAPTDGPGAAAAAKQDADPRSPGALAPPALRDSRLRTTACPHGTAGHRRAHGEWTRAAWPPCCSPARRVPPPECVLQPGHAAWHSD